MPVYLDANAATDERVADLLGRMTLEEKLGQMTLVEKGSITPADVSEYGIGALLSGGGGSPSPNSVEAWREMVTGFQDAALDTRLMIPMLYGTDAVHGHNNLRGAVIFPHNVGLGATRDADLVREIGRVTAIETAATGIRWTYSPVLAVPQDIRWGRTYEAFGEDPTLVSELGAALVEGLQGENLTEDTSVLATPKHFVGDGGTEWGSGFTYTMDQGVTKGDEDELRAVHVAPYPASFDAGAVTVMASYSSWENGKVHGDDFILTELLRDDLGFDGFVVSDWAAVDQVKPGDLYGSIVQSINAGIDLVMVPTNYELFLTAISGAVSQGDISEERIDEAVRRILTVKFDMGLFEQPMPSAQYVDQVGSQEHRTLARQAVGKSLVLLETEPDVFPLELTTSRVLLAGDAADDIGIQSGGWTISWQGRPGDVTTGTSIYDALQDVSGPELVFNKFGRFTEDGDVGIVVVAERPYAEGRGDSSTLGLSEADLGVIAKVRPRVETLVVVVIAGRPVILGPEFDEADAVVAAWLPGTEGAGIVDVFVGDMPFGGVLPFTWPDSIESLGTVRTDPCEGARFPYGYGLAHDGSLLGPKACEGAES